MHDARVCWLRFQLFLSNTAEQYGRQRDEKFEWSFSAHEWVVWQAGWNARA